MRLEPIACCAEQHAGKGPGGLLLQADAAACAPRLLAQWAGQVQAVYLDPPFNTGQRFSLKLGVGEDGWQSGARAVTLPAYEDSYASQEAFLSMMEQVLVTARDLLSDTGSIFLHIDARMHAPLRLLLDRVFGARNFVNEIIWAYQSGGRATRHFSRKHDTILFYRKSARAFFDLSATAMPRGEARSNHMRRAVDETGRAYRAIRSGGKEYRYYDDDPVYPSDVWQDISHLQQKDPERTGYDTQKPLKLLERLLLCTSRPGDLVADLFLGSGTTALAAAMHGRAFLGADASVAALITTRKRMLGYAMRLEMPGGSGSPLVEADCVPSIGFVDVALTRYALEEGAVPGALGTLDALDAVDQWSIGYVRGGAFAPVAHAARGRAMPALRKAMQMPMLDGQPALLTVDVLGRRLLHALTMPRL